jgi:hypothetical protein
MVAGFMESAVAVDIDRTGIAVIGVTEREGVTEVNVDPVGMREGDTGKSDGDESLIEIGSLKEKPVGDIKGKRLGRGEKRGHGGEEGSRLTFLCFDIGTERSKLLTQFQLRIRCDEQTRRSKNLDFGIFIVINGLFLYFPLMDLCSQGLACRCHVGARGTWWTSCKFKSGFKVLTLYACAS